MVTLGITIHHKNVEQCLKLSYPQWEVLLDICVVASDTQAYCNQPSLAVLSSTEHAKINKL